MTLPDRFLLLLACLLFCLSGLPLAAQETPASPSEPLVIGVTPSPPFSYRNEVTGEWTGISVDLWTQIAGELGWEFSLRGTTLQELIDGLAEGSFDVGAAALVPTPEREARLDFSHTFYSSGLSVATAVQDEAIVVAFLRRLFTIEALVAVGALVVVLFAVGALLWAVERRANPDQFGGAPAQGLASGFWWSAVTMTTVGYGDKAPVSAAGRAVGLVWMFASIILISGFTGAIASALTVDSFRLRIESLDDLYGARVGTVADSNAAAFLESRGIPYRGFPDTAAGLEAVSSGRLDGFVNDAPVLTYVVRRDHPGTLAVLPRTFDPGYYALAMTEGDPRLDAINLRLLEHLRSEEWRATLRRYLGE